MPRQTNFTVVPDAPIPGIDPSLYFQVPNWAIAKAIRAKLTGADWCVWHYLQMIDPFGDRLIDTPTPDLIAEAVALSEKQVKRSMHKLEELGLWEFKIIAMKSRNLAVRKKDKVVPEKTKLSTDGQSCSELDKVVPEKTKLSTDGQSCPNQPLEPAPTKTSTTLQTIQTYSDFLQTLSEGEREKFDDFCNEAIARMPTRPGHVSSWRDKYYQGLWDDFTTQNKGQSSAAPSSPQKLTLQEIWDRHGAMQFDDVAKWHGYDEEEAKDYKNAQIDNSRPPESIKELLKKQTTRGFV